MNNESGVQSDAVAKSGATGLIQWMPDTADGI